jgi:PAS domain S-box-containing protein
VLPAIRNPRIFDFMDDDGLKAHSDAESSQFGQNTSLARLVQSVHDYAIVRLSHDGTVLSWNVGAEMMTGYAASEMIGRSFECLFIEEEISAGKPRALLGQAASAGRARNEGWRLRKDGSQHRVVAVTTAVYDGAGRVEGFVNITRDSTAEQAMETALLQAVTQLEEANRRLQDHADFRTFSVAAASHELQSPLTSLKGYIDNLLEGVAGPLPERAMHYLRRMERNADRILRLATMLLDLTCLEAGHMPIALGAVSIAEVLADLLPEFQGVAAKKAITLHVAQLSDARVKADRLKLEQVLQNLLHNAIKFTPEQGRILVRSHVSGETQMTITVEDTGCGIPPDHQEKVFMRFYRAPSPVREGMGLGLAITKHLVELQGGEIRVESETGRGTRFFVSLPLA